MEAAMPELEPRERKIERLLPTLRESLDVFLSDRPLKEGSLTVIRDVQGKTQELSNLVVYGIEEEGPGFGSFDENGDPTSSAVLLWDELIDVHRSA